MSDGRSEEIYTERKVWNLAKFQVVQRRSPPSFLACFLFFSCFFLSFFVSSNLSLSPSFGLFRPFPFSVLLGTLPSSIPSFLYISPHSDRHSLDLTKPYGETLSSQPSEKIVTCRRMSTGSIRSRCGCVECLYLVPGCRDVAECFCPPTRVCIPQPKPSSLETFCSYSLDWNDDMLKMLAKSKAKRMVRICEQAHTHARTHTHTHTHTHIMWLAWANAWAHAHTHTHTHARTYWHTTDTLAHAYTHTSVCCTHTS